MSPASTASAKRTPKAAVYTAEGLLAAELIELFMRTHLVFTHGEFAGRPFVLEDWQRDNIIRPIFATIDGHGVRRYREAVIGLPRDGGKSEIAAALCLACAFTEPVYEGEYVVVARNRKQAGIVFNKMRAMVLRDPVLRATCEVRKTEIIIRETGARLYTVPWDAGSVQGIHAKVCIIDEYHVHRDDSVRNAMLSGMIGEQGSLLITISTAAPWRKGPLWELLRTAPKDRRAYIYWAGAAEGDDADDPRVWRAANPQSWVTLGMLRDAHFTLPPSSFERYHLNRFPARGVKCAFDARVWDTMDGLPVIDTKRPCVLAADASFRRDTTALVLDQVDSEGVHNVASWIFASVDGAPIDREAVMATIVEIVHTYFVERMVCDPNYFVLEMMRLVSEFGVPVEEYPQNNPRMAKAFDVLYALVSSGRIRHGGARGLREHVLNSALNETPYGPRLDKASDSQKIDAAVALAIGATIAEAEYQDCAVGPQIFVG
jgi:phage terminase large subunit-like protein